MTNRLVGILLGTAVGDALGLPAEGLSPRRRQRLLPGDWRHRFLFGRGMLSDDTEHALFVAQSLLRHPADADAFQRRLAWHLRWWFAGLPAGIGMATARACLKLWLGFPPSRSGVFSAGNGPAMRSAVIGGYFHDQPELLHRFSLASTQVTHTDPKAAVGAEAIALLAAWAVEHDPTQRPDATTIAARLTQLAPQDDAWRKLIDPMPAALAAGNSVPEFANALGLARGVTGYMLLHGSGCRLCLAPVLRRFPCDIGGSPGLRRRYGHRRRDHRRAGRGHGGRGGDSRTLAPPDHRLAPVGAAASCGGCSVGATV